MGLTVYEKLIKMAKEESQGKKDMKIKDLCGSIAKKFRMNNKEIYHALMEANKNPKMKFAKQESYNFKFL